MCAANGTAGGRDKTMSPSTMYFMLGSFSPFIGVIEGANYAECLSMIKGKHGRIANRLGIVRDPA